MKSKEQKRIDAEVRQEEYAVLSTKEKWDRIKQRPGRSQKERKKLGLV